MRKRLLKYLRRFLIVMLILGVLGLIGFSWICYWPFEGEVKELEQLIPETAEFVIRGDYDQIKDTGWIQTNVFDNPLHASLEDFAKGTGDPRATSWPKLQEELAALNQQINAQIPLGIVDFDVERDVLSGEVVVAGRWCAGVRPPQPPGWQELLLLKRLTWKPRAGLAAAIGHGFIRDMAVDPRQMKMEIDDEEMGLAKVTMPGVAVRTRIERSGCGRGFTMPPDNEWYILRVKDVVAVSNSPSMIKAVYDLSEKSDNHGEGFRAREWFELDDQKVDRNIVASVDIEPMQQYIVRQLETLGARRNLINNYVLPTSFEKMKGQLELSSEDQLVGKAQIFLRSDVIDDSEKIKLLYAMPQTPVREGLPEFVPAEHTWLTATLRSRPMHFFGSVLDMLTRDERDLLNENVRNAKNEQGEPYRDIEEVLSELAPRLGDTAWISVGRLKDIFDKVQYDEWFTAEDDPYPGFAFMMRIREGASLTEVDEFLRGKAAVMGLKEEVERREHAGIPYTRLFLKEVPNHLKHASPCYYLAQDRFIFGNNEWYFQQILETIADPSRSLARSDRFQVAMGKLENRAHLGLYVDLGMLFAAPDSTKPGAGPRGHMWDERNKKITDTLTERERLNSKRAELVASFSRRRGRHPNDQEMERINTQIDDFAAAYRESYPRLIEDYRQELLAMRRFQTLALSLGALVDDEGHQVLSAKLVVGLGSGDD